MTLAGELERREMAYSCCCTSLVAKLQRPIPKGWDLDSPLISTASEEQPRRLL